MQACLTKEEKISLKLRLATVTQVLQQLCMGLTISLFCLPNHPGGPEPAMPDVSTICELLDGCIIPVFSRSTLLSVAFYTALQF